ncbi:MAG: hypothetical protein ACK559_07435, partial [bacterium]
MAAGHVGQQPAPTLLLAQVPGRGAQVDQQIGPAGDQRGGRIRPVASRNPVLGLVPEVLADGQPEATPLPGDHRVVGGRLEVPVLVEDIIGGQQGLG